MHHTRVSCSAFQQLNEEMLVAAARCRVSKTALWVRTACGKHWDSEELFKPEEEVEEVGHEREVHVQEVEVEKAGVKEKSKEGALPA